MANKRTTKKALLASLLSLMLCCVMLIGTTFAWFTDSVTSANNRIQSGTLKVDLLMDKEETGKVEDYKSIANGNGDIFSEATGNGVLWEPGKTEIVYLAVANKGNLALKYNIMLDITDAGLAGALEYAIVDGAKATDLTEATKWADIEGYTGAQVGDMPTGKQVAAPNGKLEKDGVDYFALAVHMKEEAGNEYKEKSIQIDVNVSATQVEAENDSFGNDYDANAYLPVVYNEAQLMAALEDGESVMLGADMEVAEMIEIPENAEVVLNLNGKTLSAGYQEGSSDKHLYPISNYGDMTIVGGTITGRGIYNQDGAKLTINGAKVIGADANGGACVWSYGTGEVYLNDAEMIGYTGVVSSEGYVEINGGTYTCYSGIDDNGTQVTAPTYNIRAYDGLKITDGTFTSRHGVISVGGGEAVIEGGSYTIQFASGTTSNVVYAYGDTDLTINGGRFISDDSADKADSGAAVLVKGDSVKLTINDGVFVGMNGMVGGNANTKLYGGTYNTVWNYNHYGSLESFIAEGHNATQNADGSWTVAREYTEVTAPGTDASVNGTTLADAINATTEPTFISLGTGEYKMPSISGNKKVTIVGTKETVIDVTVGAYMDSSTIAFEGVTIKTSTGYVYDENGNKGSDYAALYSPNVTYTNCTFDGPMRVGRDGATFIKCTFNNLGNDYVWTYGNDVTFKNCTFNSEGKALLIYSDGGTEVSKVVVENCIFNATKGAKAGAIANQNCAAIEIQNYGNGVDLITKGNQIDSEFSGEWRIKSYHATQPKVVVNGVEYHSIALDGKTMTIDANNNVTVNE